MKKLRIALAMVAMLAACGAGRPGATLLQCEQLTDSVCRFVDKDYGAVCYARYGNAGAISCIAVPKASLQ